MISRMHVNRLLALLVAALTVSGCTPGVGDGNPSGGGMGIPKGTYAGTLLCTETTSEVTQEPAGETVLSQTHPSFPVSYTFGEDGIVLDAGGDPLAVGSTISATVGNTTADATVRTLTSAIDRLEVIADAVATVDIPERGERVMPGVVTVVYEFAEPDTVSVSTDKVFTSNVIDGQFIKIVAECSADLPFQR